MMCPAIGPEHIYTDKLMQMTQISRDLLNEITEVVEDTIEYACDQHMLSGELVWAVVECLAIAKQAELKGQVISD